MLHDPSKETPMSDGVLARLAGDHPSLEESIRQNSAHPGHVNDWLVASIPLKNIEKYYIVS
jgi:hypothetical protein